MLDPRKNRNIRLGDDELLLIERAAAAERMTVSEFIRRAAVEKAKTLIEKGTKT